MDYYNSNNQGSQDIEMAQTYIRSGPENMQYNDYGNQSGGTFRNATTPSFGGGRGTSSFYRPQNQPGNDAQQYGNNRDFGYEGSSQSPPGQFMSSQSSQYMSSNNQRGGGQQFNYKSQQPTWRMEKMSPGQDYYKTGNTGSPPSTRGFGTKTYPKGGHWAQQNDSFTENQGPYNKEYRGRGRGRGGNIGTGQSPVSRGRGFSNSSTGPNSAPSNTFNTFDGKQNTRGVMRPTRPARGGYQNKNPDNIKKNFNSVKRNEPMEQDKPKIVGILKKPPVQSQQNNNLPQVSPSTVAASTAKNDTNLKNPTQSTSNKASDPKQEAEELEEEIVEAGDGDGEAKAERKKRLPWKFADGGIRKRRKKTPAEKNMKVKKYVQPKNAVMCLNELAQGIVFNVEQECTDGTSPIGVSVEVNGQKYKGFGSSKQMAKQAAAEAALVSFVKPPTTDAPDNTPWTVLACFAMYKLFNEWREGRIGLCHPGFSTGGPFGVPLVQDATMSQSIQNMVASNMANANEKDRSQMSSVLAAYLGCKDTAVKKEDPNAKQGPNPAKQVPENATSMHPVMLLHQMRPQLVYTQSAVIKDNQQLFSLSCCIDNVTFSGEGTNLKKAKVELALKANKQLFGVESTYQTN